MNIVVELTSAYDPFIEMNFPLYSLLLGVIVSEHAECYRYGLEHYNVVEVYVDFLSNKNVHVYL